MSNVNSLLAVDLSEEKQLFLVDLVEIQSRGTPGEPGRTCEDLGSVSLSFREACGLSVHRSNLSTTEY